MPRNPKPLTILVEQDICGSEEIQELIRKGHDVKVMVDVFDLILGPNCQLMTKEHLRYLPEAIKRVRKIKYGGEKDAAL